MPARSGNSAAPAKPFEELREPVLGPLAGLEERLPQTGPARRRRPTERPRDGRAEAPGAEHDEDDRDDHCANRSAPAAALSAPIRASGRGRPRATHEPPSRAPRARARSRARSGGPRRAAPAGAPARTARSPAVLAPRPAGGP